jgi:hypothetical protein
MAIDVAGTGHTLLWYALAQNDVDMQNHQLLNLDTSNLQALGAPPTFVSPAHQWIRAWDNPTHVWTASQPNFTDLAGQLTLGVNGQQRHITELGTINVGTWQGGIISGEFLAKLDQIRQPGSDVNMASKRLINLANPINAQDAVTKSFMDMLLQGLNPKEAVRVATTRSSLRRGLDPVDGVAIHAGDRILVKDESPGVPGRMGANGIWIAHTDSWTRAPDCDTFDELNRAYCTVREGNVNIGTSWVQSLPLTAEGQDKWFLLFAVIGAGGGEPGPPGPGVPPGGAIDAVLVKNSPDDYDTKWIVVPGITPPNYAAVQTAKQDTVAGTTSAAFKMMGLGANAVITLVTSGKLTATINGWMWNNNSAGAVIAQLRIGTGAAPHNGDNPPAGSIPIGGFAGCARLNANAIVPFSLSFVLGGIGTGVPIWMDIQLATSQGIGTANIGAVSVSACEIP